MKVEVAVLGCPSIIVLTVSVDVKKHDKNKKKKKKQVSMLSLICKHDI